MPVSEPRAQNALAYPPRRPNAAAIFAGCYTNQSPSVSDSSRRSCRADSEITRSQGRPTQRYAKPTNPTTAIRTNRPTPRSKAVIDQAHLGDLHRSALMHHLRAFRMKGSPGPTRNADKPRGLLPANRDPDNPACRGRSGNIPIPPRIHGGRPRKLDAAHMSHPTRLRHRRAGFASSRKRQDVAHRTQPRAAEPSHNKTRRGHPFHRPPANTSQDAAAAVCLRLVCRLRPARGLAETSRDLTTFQSPFYTLRLVTSRWGGLIQFQSFMMMSPSYYSPRYPTSQSSSTSTHIPIRGPEGIPSPTAQRRIPDNPGRRFVQNTFKTSIASCSAPSIAAARIVASSSPPLRRRDSRGRTPLHRKGDSPTRNISYKIDEPGPRARASQRSAARLGTIGAAACLSRTCVLRANPLVHPHAQGRSFAVRTKAVGGARRSQTRATNVARAPTPSIIPPTLQSSESTPSSIAVGFYLCQADPETRASGTMPDLVRFLTKNGNSFFFFSLSPQTRTHGLSRLRAYEIFIVGVPKLQSSADARHIRENAQQLDTAPSASLTIVDRHPPQPSPSSFATVPWKAARSRRLIPTATPARTRPRRGETLYSLRRLGRTTCDARVFSTRPAPNPTSPSFPALAMSRPNNARRYRRPTGGGRTANIQAVPRRSRNPSR